MHIESKKIMNRYRKWIYIFVGMSLCTNFCSCGSNTKVKEKTQEEIAQIFDWDDEYNLLNKSLTEEDTANAFEIREMEQQVEGYWDYYEQYIESREELDKVIQEWDTDFITAGIYEVGKDIAPGMYVFCDANDSDGKEEENTIEIFDDWEQQKKIGWGILDLSEYIYYYTLREGEIVKITGNPKFAEVSEFPEDKEPRDGVYYGTIYKVGEEITPGEYFILSMDIEDGTIDSYCTNGKTYPISSPEYGQHERNRFGYFRIEENDGYLKLENSILISLESKPNISPVSHENISYLNRDKGVLFYFKKFLFGQEHEEDYEQLVYVQGEYKIGEDIPLGVYQIQSEIAWPISDLESEEYHSDTYNLIRLEEQYYNWSALYIPYEDMAEQCGWKYIRLSEWCHYDEYQSNQYIKTVDDKGEVLYSWVTEGNLPTVTFSEEDVGCIVRVTRAILIPN